MKQTVLEWFIQEFEKEPTKANLDRLNEQAKEMEKQQQCYSEEDLKEAFFDGWVSRDGNLPFTKAKNEWFEQFKKK